MSEKIYVGKGKKDKFEVVKIGIKPGDLVQHANAKGYVNLVVTLLRAPDNWGNTHTVYIDTWQPGQSSGSGASDSNYNNNDMPF